MEEDADVDTNAPLMGYTFYTLEKEFFVDNLLVRIHLIIEMI